MKQLLCITTILFLGCLAAGPGQAAESTSTSTSSGPITSSITLQPIRVVYQQMEGTFLKSPRGVWVDNERNEIYVADTSNDLVAIYDSIGLPLFAFGYNQELKEPTKAIRDSKDHILVLNGIPKAIRIFTYRGEYLNDFPLNLKDSKDAPTAIGIDQLGNLYTAISTETGNVIQVYDPNFRLVREFGKKPDGTSYLKAVQGISFDEEGNVFVADASATPAIQVYSREGSFLRGWGAHDAGPQNFSLPSGITLDGDGRVIVTDTIRQTMMIFTKEGAFLNREGGMGTQAGTVMFPTDIASNGKGKLYVVERLGSRLQVLEERRVTSRGAQTSEAATNALREQMRRQFNELRKGMN